MIRVKISDFGDMPPIIRQTPSSSGIWKDCQFYINEDTEEVDYWVIMHSVSKPETTRCRPGHLLLLTGEPASVASYPNRYIRQFDAVLSCQKSLQKKGAIRSVPASPWFVGAKMLSRDPWRWDAFLDYDSFLEEKDTDGRLDKIAVITSNKRLTRGHIKRLNFIRELQKEFPRHIDVFGTGFKNIEDKFDVYKRYKYALVIENSNYPDYWTEKLADCYLGGCLPFYCGCPNLSAYFSPDAYIQLRVDQLGQAKEEIKNAIRQDLFSLRFSALKTAKQQILNQYNLFNIITGFIHAQKDEPRSPEPVTVYPLSDFTTGLKHRIIRKAKRLYLKFYMP